MDYLLPTLTKQGIHLHVSYAVILFVNTCYNADVKYMCTNGFTYLLFFQLFINKLVDEHGTIQVMNYQAANTVANTWM